MNTHLLRNFLLLLLPLGLPSMLAAQDVYHPLVQEGKRWVYTEDYETASYENIIRGDTIIGGKNYKRLLRKNRNDSDYFYEAAMREADRRVYVILNGETEEHLIYDFFLSQQMDATEVDGGAFMTLHGSYRHVLYDGEAYRREWVIFHGGSGGGYSASGGPEVLEGIGGFRTNLINLNDATVSVKECYLDGKLLYDDKYDKNANYNYPYILPPKPVVVEGRKWTYRYAPEGETYDGFITHRLDGDTLIGGGVYKKLFESNPMRYDDNGEHLRAAIREDSDRLIWHDITSEKETTLSEQGMLTNKTLDFGSVEDDAQTVWVRYVRNISNCDRTYRVMFLYDTDERDRYVGKWIEGIGNSSYGLFFGKEAKDYVLCSVADGDKCIYSIEGNPGNTSDIVSPSSHKSVSVSQKTPALYDLQGRRLKGEPARGLYIKDGKKVVR